MSQLPLPEGREDSQALSFETLLASLAAHQRAAGLLSEAERRLESLKARADQLVAALKT